MLPMKSLFMTEYMRNGVGHLSAIVKGGGGDE
jgi:hypothetical protein